MTQIPLLYGIKGSPAADFDVSLPVNMEPVPVESGISKGYLRSLPGAVLKRTGPGIDRGAILWNGYHMRVMGNTLVYVANGVINPLVTIPGTGPVGLDYGFGRLAINADNRLFYWDGTALTEVTDPDLGPVLDMIWMDGYYVTTDGTSIIVTDLTDPTSVNPLRYGSAEADPDMVTGLAKLRGELIAFGRNTIEFYADQGGSGFPFQVNVGATINRGCVGPRAKAYFIQSIAFVGGGRNEAIGVHLIGSGTSSKISTRAIDDELAKVADPSSITTEVRVSRDENRLFIHLPDKSLVYLSSASAQAGQPVWYIAASGLGMDKPYRARNALLVNGEWWVGDTETAGLGVLDDQSSDQFGETAGWQFDTLFVYNSANSAIIHTLELVGMPGRSIASDPVVMFSSTIDGETYSMERANRVGRPGNRRKRVVWNPHRRFRNYMGLRFRGIADGPVSWAALESDIEALAV